ncbi:MAG: hypothetical protein QF890_00580 [Myxococcota bacterium]|jgi:hypothetical protein|nr:hypothetical protein [Deltaproteobacteria bacterium]MCP4239928.1 hypothetical protein [bacterium]MDP6073953.1 hypothetical protein [Myxococcota bacterium]MBT39961.1 hypothetical protein [Deltaproteobacteria bacterium]MDP6241862.1 hypothetical protein [Myxococcota bacterium]|tara:strand:- start:360 stop:632 length:273 start_codon:yes stop_codon:yes gene_type:complete
MQQQDGPRTPFEVFCHNCRVTFAAGTKHCIHCGARLSGSRNRPTVEMPPDSKEFEIKSERPKRSLPFSPMTLLWVILLLGAGLQRACHPG